MNKASSKLAAGVRKVKVQQKPDSAALKPAQPQAVERTEKLAVKLDSNGGGSAMHPTRVWPD